MIFKIIWQPNFVASYEEEIDFIFRKWTSKEVHHFQDLVNHNLSLLTTNPTIGTFNKSLGVYALVISKQTTLYYGFNEKTKIIDLYLFWNNLKNPKELNKLL